MRMTGHQKRRIAAGVIGDEAIEDDVELVTTELTTELNAGMDGDQYIVTSRGNWRLTACGTQNLMYGRWARSAHPAPTKTLAVSSTRSVPIRPNKKRSGPPVRH
jgi:hypothetical protein